MDAKQKQRAKDIFRDGCLNARPFGELVASYGLDNEPQFRDELRGLFLLKTTCRHCGQPLDAARFAVWNTYWKSLWAPCHAECREAGMKIEVFDCQSIDADCNDCRHFERGKSVGLPVVCRSYFGEVKADGHCNKFDKPARSASNFCSGYPCFEHRKSGS